MHNGLTFIKSKIQLLILLIFLGKYAASQNPPCKKTWPVQTIYSMLSNGKSSSIPLGRILDGCNYNDTIKKMLLEAVEKRWTYTEIDSFVDSIFREKEHNFYIEDRIYKLLKPASFIEYSKFKDSIIIQEKKQIYNENKYLFKVDKSLLLNIGFLRVYEAEKQLRKYLLNPEFYDEYFVKLALARLGDKKTEEEIIKNLANLSNLEGWDWVDNYFNNVNVLTYIGSKESIYQIASYIDTVKRYNHVSNGSETLCSNLILLTLIDILENEDFKLLLKNLRWTMYDDNQARKSLLLAVKEWLLKNKGNYKINQYYISPLFK